MKKRTINRIDELMEKYTKKYNLLEEQANWKEKKGYNTDSEYTGMRKYEDFLNDLYELKAVIDNKYYYTIEYEHEETVTKSFGTKEELFRAVIGIKAFDDCYDFEFKKIICDGKPVHYIGWQPKMEYEYHDEDGNVVWDEFYPEYEH